MLCGALLALSVWSHAEGAKVLGFTMDAPAPDDAELLAEGGGYALHRLEHRFCANLMASSDDLGVFVVTCRPARGVDWNALLSAKYGSPVVDLITKKLWAVDGFALTFNSNEATIWWASRIAPTLDEHSSVGDVSTALKDALGKAEDAVASLAAATNADVIAEEDF